MADPITYEDYLKVELRTATILETFPIPKANKLIGLKVSIGEDTPRVIIAGIAKYFTPEQLLGRRIIVVANLAAREMFGFSSSGMVLGSHNTDGTFALATCPDVPDGSRLG